MSLRLTYLMRSIKQSVAVAERAQARGDMATAGKHYLQVAASLMRASEAVADTDTRELRERQAAAMRERAQFCLNQPASLNKTTGKTTPSGTKKSAQTANDKTQSSPNSQATPTINDEAQFVFTPVVADNMPSFSDVIGQETLIAEIRERMIEPLIYPELTKQAKLKTGGGMLLYGPSGTGKTLMARALVSEVDAVFYAVKASELMNQYVGNSEKAIAALFTQARAQERAVIYFDEIEALVPARQADGHNVMTRVVTQFLTEMDGFAKSDKHMLMVLASTNAPWMIDEAILRPGRFDVHVYVGLPSYEARKAMLQRQMQCRPTVIDNYEQLAIDAEGLSGADIEEVGYSVGRLAFKRLKTNPEAKVMQAEISELLVKQRRSVSREKIEEFKRWRL